MDHHHGTTMPYISIGQCQVGVSPLVCGKSKTQRKNTQSISSYTTYITYTAYAIYIPVLFWLTKTKLLHLATITKTKDTLSLIIYAKT